MALVTERGQRVYTWMVKGKKAIRGLEWNKQSGVPGLWAAFIVDQPSTQIFADPDVPFHTPPQLTYIDSARMLVARPVKVITMQLCTCILAVLSQL